MGKALGITNTSQAASGAGGGLTITLPGTLAIGSNAGQVPAFFNAATKLSGATLAVTQAPTGAALVVNIGLTGSPETVLLTLTIPAGQTSVAAGSSVIAALATIPANTNIQVDITAVGTTFPGAGLTLNLF